MSEVERLTREREYLAAMLAAYDKATLDKDRGEQKRHWLTAARKAVEQGWRDEAVDA